MAEKKYTSYCGLYCQDCIPSNKKLFGVIKTLRSVLEELQFEKYARIKSQKDQIFAQYPIFAKLLTKIAALECTAPCREGGVTPNCKIRDCVLNRDYVGCWDCDEHKSCELLKPLKQVHSNLEYHLALIKNRGLENWNSERKGHYYFQQT
jgi:hypothetical protein